MRSGSPRKSVEKPVSKKATAAAKTKPARESPLPRQVARVALDRATARIRGLQRDLRANVWKIGRELTQVATFELFAARGHATFEGYADEVLGLSRDSAYQYMRVSEAFSEAMVESYGVEKLDRLLRYIAATPERDGPEDAPELKIRVPEAGGGVTEKPFSQVSLHELRAATGAERAAQGGGARDDGAAEVARTLDADARVEVQRALEGAIDEAIGRAAEGTEVRVAAAAGGAPTVSLRDVPLEHADAALAAVRKALKRALAEVWTDA